ncbi:ABC transporter ATP-binding protein [Methylopila turkensis]|uniref:ABC transporter ATP-binding protein n=1 Tax=Methylopila turkensis TaxID=1437816 RepID=A0A9W6N5P5_9HYPH|nr:ABC transporter ATP-binding protein [Methylopila turkensis]GLK78447.1 ABC transporter ATP-binding protein [Methylopila turkensis]
MSDAVAVEAVGMTMRFGAFTALDDVSIKVPAGSFHALLGENGAGKSTLVKCMMGFYTPTSGQMLVDSKEAVIRNPKDAAGFGLGMVYQHFTLVPSLTGAENLVISREDAPRVIDWRKERKALAAFMETMPFKIPLDQPVSALAAGEKQKLEIVKQLYLGRRFIVLDEPTSVLTPNEAEEMLGLVRGMTRAGALTVLMISHKFHEVTSFCDDVTVLRKGRRTGGGRIADLDRKQMAAMMIGDQPIVALDSRSETPADATPVLTVKQLKAKDRTGLKSIAIDGLEVRAGEIVGIAGISGNGQKEFLETIAGQRAREGGAVVVKDTVYDASRAQSRALNVRFIPEEPLRNACAPRMTVAENIAFRTFDLNADGKPVAWISARAIRAYATRLIEQFKVKTASLSSPIQSLSGGNVQRAVLARELTGQVDLLVVSNPCFGLDFAAVAEIRARIMKARNGGAAVLLMSEDLDELLELSDRIFVMSDGALVYETPIAQADVHVIGEHMAGH